MTADQTVTFVAAVARNDVIGGPDGKLPWKMPRDYRHHLRLVKDQVVVLGHRTFEQYSKPPGRLQLVFTRFPDQLPEGVMPVASADEAIAAAREAGADELFVLGGSHVYARMWRRCTKAHLTLISADCEGDYLLPLRLFNFEWGCRSVEFWPADENNEYDAQYCVYFKYPTPPWRLNES